MGEQRQILAGAAQAADWQLRPGDAPFVRTELEALPGRSFRFYDGGESLYGAMFAMSTLSLVPVFVVFLAFQRLIIRGVALGALKR